MKLIAKTDPGHGWLQVPMALIERLNIVDIHRAMQKHGIQYTVDHIHTDKDSIIRQYQPFK
jgi:hypothetical protein